MDLTRDEWLSELEGLTTDSDGLTILEIAARMKISKHIVRKKLAEAQAQGRLVVGRKATAALDGRQANVPSYRIKPQ